MQARGRAAPFAVLVAITRDIATCCAQQCAEPMPTRAPRVCVGPAMSDATLQRAEPRGDRCP